MAHAPPPTVPEKDSCPPGSPSWAAPWTANGSSTCTRAQVPWAWKPSPGERATPSSWRPTPEPPAPSARTSGASDSPAPKSARAKPNRSSGRGRRPSRGGKPKTALRGGAPTGPSALVFLAPPYRVTDHDLREILLTLRTEHWLAPQALVTVERSTRGGEFQWPPGFDAVKARRYGEGTFWYGRAASTCEDAR